MQPQKELIFKSSRSGILYQFSLKISQYFHSKIVLDKEHMVLVASKSENTHCEFTGIMIEYKL